MHLFDFVPLMEIRETNQECSVHDIEFTLQSDRDELGSIRSFVLTVRFELPVAWRKYIWRRKRYALVTSWSVALGTSSHLEFG